MGKRDVSNFDQRICNGTHPDVDGVCPKRASKGESTGNRMVDALSRLESEALEAATGEEQFKCGICGCNLPNLELASRAPETCPRLELHDR